MGGVLKALWGETQRDRLSAEAARVAYYLFLSLFPLILTVMALTGLLGGEATFEWIMGRLRTMVPGSASELLGGFVRDVTSDEQPGVLGLGLLLTIWAASGGFSALGEGMDRMYDLKQGRSWFRQRLVAFTLATAGSLMLVGGAILLVAGPELFGAVGLGVVWTVLRWPAAFLLACAFFWILLHWLPNRDQSSSRREITIGALFGTGLWLAGTGLFRLYVANFGSYNETYGFVGAIIVLMLWLYLTGIAALAGTELAAVLEARRRGAPSGRMTDVRDRAGAAPSRPPEHSPARGGSPG